MKKSQASNLFGNFLMACRIGFRRLNRDLHSYVDTIPPDEVFMRISQKCKILIVETCPLHLIHAPKVKTGKQFLVWWEGDPEIVETIIERHLSLHLSITKQKEELRISYLSTEVPIKALMST